jgi:hypothetical protein
MSASTDPRKGKPGQSCAECRRSVFHTFCLFPPAYSSDSERPGRNSNVTGRVLYCVLGTRSTMNMGKETFLVSRASEEVAQLYVQMVSLLITSLLGLTLSSSPSRNSGGNEGKQVSRAAS